MSFDIIKGMATTFKNIGKKPTTVSYPEEERELPARFRGLHVLHRYENDLERCVGCYLCAGACPADAIYIETEENTEKHRIYTGERYTIDRVRRPSVRDFSDWSLADGIAAALAPETSARPAGSSLSTLSACPALWKGAQPFDGRSSFAARQAAIGP
jgi:ferredoxin